MADQSNDPRDGQALYSEDEESPPTAQTAPNKPTHGLSHDSSTSSLSEALDPDADAEGEPDDLDADADGIEDDDVMDYSFDPTNKIPAQEEDGEDGSGEDDADDAEDEGMEEEEEEEEDSGEEMDLDENASSPPPSPPSRHSDQPPDAATNKKPLVLKLKLAGQASATAPPAKRKYVRRPADSKSPSGRSRSYKKTGSSTRRRDTDEEDDELAEDALGSDSDGDDDPSGTHTGLYQAWDESDGASTGDDTFPTVGQLTVRQRAKEYGEPVTDLQSLPMSDGKKKKELTEADRAMEKAEKSRKRKHQNEKKLEDEKTETINRLLKGQIGKAGRSSSSKIAGGPPETTEENNNQAANVPAPPPVPTMIRRISSIRSGEYVTSLSVPSSILSNPQTKALFNSHPSTTITYPPKTRPPPKTWKLVNGVRVN